MTTYVYSNDDGATWYNEICEVVEDNVEFFDGVDTSQDTITITQAEMVKYEFPEGQLARLADYVQESISEYLYDDLGEDAANSAERVMKKSEDVIKVFLAEYIKQTINVGGIYKVGEEKEIEVKIADYVG